MYILSVFPTPAITMLNNNIYLHDSFSAEPELSLKIDCVLKWWQRCMTYRYHSVEQGYFPFGVYLHGHNTYISFTFNHAVNPLKSIQNGHSFACSQSSIHGSDIGLVPSRRQAINLNKWCLSILTHIYVTWFQKVDKWYLVFFTILELCTQKWYR